MAEFEWVDIDSFIFPNPRERIGNPEDTPLQRGDIVQAKIGPATGKLGIVVVERNGNYEDCLDEVGLEQIGVGFAEGNPIDQDLMKMLESARSGLIPKIRTVIRWFDSPEQLEVVASVK